MSQSIVVYTSEGCAFCSRLKSFLTNHNLTFEEKNVTSNPEYLDELQSKGIWAVPTVFVGDEVVPGYRPNKLKEILGLE